jgi:hypothetical protein
VNGPVGVPRHTFAASDCSLSNHMPSWRRLTRVCWETFFAKGSVSGSRIQHRESCCAAFPKPVACERGVKERAGGRVQSYLPLGGISTPGSSPHWRKVDQRSLRMVAGPSAPGCTLQGDRVGGRRNAAELTVLRATSAVCWVGWRGANGDWQCGVEVEWCVGVCVVLLPWPWSGLLTYRKR